MEETTSSAEKLLQVLELLALSQNAMGPTEIGKALHFNKTTIYRLLQIMSQHGYVEKNSTGAYSIGPKLIEIASYHINNLELQVVAKPFLSMLYAELNLATHLGILDGAEIIYVEKMDLYPTGAGFAQVGYRTPAYCSSIGKCLLASLSGDDLDEVLYQYHFKKYTKNTITNLYEFKNHLRQVRKQGWAMDKEEYLLGSRCIGAPIYDFQGEAIACVSVSGTSEQLSDERIPAIVEKVKYGAAMISHKMGYIEVQ